MTVIWTHWPLGDAALILNTFEIFKLISRIDILSLSNEIALRWMTKDLTHDTSTSGTKPLPHPMLAQLYDTIWWYQTIIYLCPANLQNGRPHWVNPSDDHPSLTCVQQVWTTSVYWQRRGASPLSVEAGRLQRLRHHQHLPRQEPATHWGRPWRHATCRK